MKPNRDHLHALLRADSIAIVGASNKTGSFGGQVLHNLVAFGFPGPVYPVHPGEKEVQGQRCFPSLSDLPTRPDCVAFAISNQRLMPALEEAAHLGVPAVVIFGDPHVGEGRDPHLEAQIAQVAGQHEMAVCGANAMGLYNLPHKLVISGYPVRPNKPAGNIALITHSGTVFDSMSQNDRDVHFNYVISSGNETVLTAADYLKFVVEDPATRVVACYLETVRDPDGFVQALDLAAQQKIPVVALKVGLSERGQAMALAHTGALAGSAETYAALFRRYSVRQVHTLDEMMDTIELFSGVPRAHGTGVSILMESGGERSLVTDWASTLGLSLAELSGATLDRLGSILEPGVVPDNPLDAFGTGSRVVEIYEACLRALDDDVNTGLLVLAVDLARDSYLSPYYVEAALRAQPELQHPLIGLVNLSSGANDRLVSQLRAAGIPVTMGTETGLRAVQHLIEFSASSERTTDPPTFVGRPAPNAIRALRERLARFTSPPGEHTSKKLLAAYGFQITREAVVKSVDEALEAAERVGYPLALKTAAAEILHKSQAGGVHLNLENGGAVRSAYAALADRFGPSVLVQEMAPGGVEIIFGMKADPQFGPVLLVGIGGVLVELYEDVITAMPPLTRAEAEHLPGLLRGSKLLAGSSADRAATRAALTDALLRFSTFVTDLGDLLSEVDLNPIVLSPDSAKVVDALIVPCQFEGSHETGS